MTDLKDDACPVILWALDAACQGQRPETLRRGQAGQLFFYDKNGSCTLQEILQFKLYHKLNH